MLHNPHSLLISINCQVCARTLWYWGYTDQWPGRCLLVTRGKLPIKKKWDLVQYSLYNSIRTFLLNKYMRIQLLAKFMNSFVCCDRVTSQLHFLYRTSWATLFVVVVPLSSCIREVALDTMDLSEDFILHFSLELLIIPLSAYPTKMSNTL